VPVVAAIAFSAWPALRSPTRLLPCCCASRTAPETPPHIYFDWIEGNPLLNLLRYLFFGVGEVAPVTREILRRAEPVRHRASTSPDQPIRKCRELDTADVSAPVVTESRRGGDGLLAE